MTEPENLGRAVASVEDTSCSDLSTGSSERVALHVDVVDLRPRNNTGFCATMQDAEMLAQRHDLPLPRILAVQLDKMKLYWDRHRRATSKTQRERVVSSQALDMYNKLVGLAYWLDLSHQDDPWLDKVAAQGTPGMMYQIAGAIHVIGRFGRPVKEYEPLVPELQSSLAILAGFLTFVCGGTLHSSWRGDGNALRSLLADFQKICGTSMPDELVLECWSDLTCERKRNVPVSMKPRLNRAEQTELAAWRAKLAAGS